MKKYNLYEAKTHFSKIIHCVEKDEEILISRNGKTVAKIIPFKEKLESKRQFGTLKGKMTIAADFDAPLPLDILQGFYGQTDDESTS